VGADREAVLVRRRYVGGTIGSRDFGEGLARYADTYKDVGYVVQAFPAKNQNDGVAGPSLASAGAWAIAAYAMVQLVVRLRHFLYPGNTLWTEEGFRFAWRVMLIEKSGELELTVVDRDGRRRLVEPREYLTPFQTRMASTQPDMILELAHVARDDYNRRGLGPVKVHADARVSWNGRLSAPMIDPSVDLAAESDGLAPKRWILPAPSGPPVF
jgi:hypothetical protein